jgi:O-antigen ligase
VLGALAVAAAAAAAIAPRVYRRLARVSVPALLHRATIAASVSTLVAVVVLSGGPSGLVHRGVSGFTAPPRPTESESTRLLTLSSNLRDAYWRAAWEDARAHPLLGSGAGTFGDYWRAHPRLDTSVLDAHNLYLETLAELGPVGLALVLALAGLPLAAAVRARRHPVVPAAAAAWVAYLVHAALDWDWEMPAVTLVALAAAAVPLSASGARVRLPRIAAACAGGAVAALAIAGTFAYASV